MRKILAFFYFGAVAFIAEMAFQGLRNHFDWAGVAIFGVLGGFYCYLGIAALRNSKVASPLPVKAVMPDAVPAATGTDGKPLTLIERRIAAEKGPSIEKRVEDVTEKLQAVRTSLRGAKMAIYEGLFILGAVVMTLIFVLLHGFQLVSWVLGMLGVQGFL